MTYNDALEYLYSSTPLFQKIGAAAYKPGLDTAYLLNKAFSCPDKAFQAIHVAGTNGKGSTCHMLASILQKAGFKTALYTSPHLIDFRERIKINGQMIAQGAVVDFISRYLNKKLEISPSFFELTTIMAFDYFRAQKVDIAVIETGLGGRLDTTNIIEPILTIITNISKDHIAQLGNTLESIATEKAGIIKPNVPVIIGKSTNRNVDDIFQRIATEKKAPITFVKPKVVKLSEKVDNRDKYVSVGGERFLCDLVGNYQQENVNTVFEAIDELRKQKINIPVSSVKEGLANVCETTNFRGRWTKLSDYPLTICDTGHNVGGWQFLGEKLKEFSENLIMVIGFVNDKDISSILSLMPKKAFYIFCNAHIPRALDAYALHDIANSFNLNGMVIPNVEQAYRVAVEKAQLENATIFIGGSTFVVADLLSSLKNDEE